MVDLNHEGEFLRENTKIRYLFGDGHLCEDCTHTYQFIRSLGEPENQFLRAGFLCPHVEEPKFKPKRRYRRGPYKRRLSAYA